MRRDVAVFFLNEVCFIHEKTAGPFPLYLKVPVAPNKYPLDKFLHAARLVSFATKGNAGRKMLSLLALASSSALLQSSLRVTDHGSARTAVVPRAHSRCSLTWFDAGRYDWVDARFSKIGFDLIQVLNWNSKIAASADSATASADNVAASSNSVAGSSNTRRTGSPSVSASIFATGILVVGAQAGNPPWQRAASLLGAIVVYNQRALGQIWKQLPLRRAISPEDLPSPNTRPRRVPCCCPPAPPTPASPRAQSSSRPCASHAVIPFEAR